MPATQGLLPLRAIAVHELLELDPPVTRIRTDEDVLYWKTTRGYQDFGVFLRRLNESVMGFNLPYEEAMGDVRPVALKCTVVDSPYSRRQQT